MQVLERAELHLKEILKIEPAPAMWPKMILGCLATSLPLFLGYFTGHLQLAIYGSLAGHMLSINDHFGNIGHRVWTVTLTFFLLVVSFMGGVYLHERPWEFVLVFTAMAYWLGLLGGEGAELERAVLFSLIMILAANARMGLTGDVAHFVVGYVISGYVILVGGMVAIAIMRGHNPAPYAGLRDSFKKSVTILRSKHLHAASFALTALVAYYASEPLGVNKAYWTAVTTLIIMKPDRTQSFYRSAQRFLGTVFGVLTIEALLHVLKTPLPVVILISILSIFVPWAAKKSYIVLSFVITVFVLLLLDLPIVEQGDFETPWIRLYATALGCIFAMFGSGLTLSLDLVFEYFEKIKQTRKDEQASNH